jgi:hypothetical protein
MEPACNSLFQISALKVEFFFEPFSKKERVAESPESGLLKSKD